MTIKVYEVVQHNEWCNPGMHVAVDDNGYVVWIQTNGRNDLTRMYFDEDRDLFNISHYKSAIFIREEE
jgi:hypothetical protein